MRSCATRATETRQNRRRALPRHEGQGFGWFDRQVPRRHTEADAFSAGRRAVDIRRFPWIPRLASDYAFDYARLADFFAGDPGDTSAWREAIARASTHTGSANARRGASGAATTTRLTPRNARIVRHVRRPASVAVVTGQQAGRFGGPLFTLLKALTALQLAGASGPNMTYRP